MFTHKLLLDHVLNIFHLQIIHMLIFNSGNDCINFFLRYLFVSVNLCICLLDRNYDLISIIVHNSPISFCNLHPSPPFFHFLSHYYNFGSANAYPAQMTPLFRKRNTVYYSTRAQKSPQYIVIISQKSLNIVELLFFLSTTLVVYRFAYRGTYFS
jgi:hypothetical protein